MSQPDLTTPPAPPRPPEPRLPGGIDLLLVVALVWSAELGLAVMLGVMLGLTQGPSFELTDYPFVVAASSVLSGLITLTVIGALLRFKFRRPLARGLALRPVTMRGALGCVGLGVAGAAAAIAAAWGAAETDSFMERLTSTPSGVVAVGVLALLMPPVEEIYYRGFLFPILRRTMGAVAGGLLIVVWFGAAHSFQLAGNWRALAVITVMGALWTWQRHRTDSLTPPLLTHLSYNASLIGAGLLSP